MKKPIEFRGLFYDTELARKLLKKWKVDLTVQSITAAARDGRLKARYVGVWLFEHDDLAMFASRMLKDAL